MLDPKESGVTMTSSHKISFSIIDILDPQKFNSKRANELSTVAEKFPVPNAEESSPAEGNLAVCAETGEKRGNFEVFIRIYNSIDIPVSLQFITNANFKVIPRFKKNHIHIFYKKKIVNTLKKFKKTR